MNRNGALLNRAAAVLGALLAVALAARVVWELLRPVVPALAVLLALCLAYYRLVRR